MITPRFTCTQTEQSLIISIYCPSVRVRFLPTPKALDHLIDALKQAADVEIHVDDTLFSVHVNPYFLRLNFSYPLLEDEASQAAYDPSSGYLTITLTKQNKGQIFDDLDLLSKLLAPRPSVQQPMIEVISGDQAPEEEPSEEDKMTAKIQMLSLEREEILRAAENDWQLTQEVPELQLSTSVQEHYGFLDMHSGYFKHVTHTENEVNELGSEVETCTLPERHQKRLRHEEEKFDPEYYMADYADDAYIRDLLEWRHPHSINEGFHYTDEENLAMLRLPRKEYLPTPMQIHNLYLTLLTLLFSYAYESRTTQREPTPESAWTIASLTPAFSALDPPGSLAITPESYPLKFTSDELCTTLSTSYRRSLAFPLYRSFILAERCRMDVAQFLTQGKRTVLRCLLEMKNILDHHAVYYVYSKVWVDDFCVWTQAYARDDILANLGESLKDLKIDKSLLGWDLEALEAATQEQRESDSDDSDSDDSSLAFL